MGFGKNMLIRIGLCAYLLLSLCSLQGMVLCFEQSGEVSLETAINGICSESFQETEQPLSLAANHSILGTSHCKRCVDIPISLHGTVHSHDRLQVFQLKLDVPPLATTEQRFIGYLTRATVERLPQPPPPKKPTIHSFLSTVVLLI